MLISECQLCCCRLKGQPAGKNHVIPQNFWNFESITMVLLQNKSYEFEIGGGGQGRQRSLSANFQKVYFTCQRLNVRTFLSKTGIRTYKNMIISECQVQLQVQVQLKGQPAGKNPISNVKSGLILENRLHEMEKDKFLLFFH